MKRTQSFQRKVFFRNRILLLLLSLPSLCILIYRLNQYRISLEYQTPMFFGLKYGLTFSIVYFIVFIFIGYEYSYSLKAVSLDEALRSVPRARSRVFLSQTRVLAACSFFTALLHFIEDMVFYCSGVPGNSTLLWHIVQSDLLNVFFVCLIASLIGATLGIFWGRIRSYLFIILLLFVTTPLNEELITPLGAHNSWIYKVKDFFAFCRSI